MPFETRLVLDASGMSRGDSGSRASAKATRTFVRFCLSAFAICSVILGFSLHLHAQYAIDSLQGDITQNEADSYISNVSAIPIPTRQWTSTVTHNYLADGDGGQ